MPRRLYGGEFYRVHEWLTLEQCVVHFGTLSNALLAIRGRPVRVREVLVDGEWILQVEYKVITKVC